MAHYPPLLATPKETPENKYANKKPPHYYYKVSGIEPYTGPWNEETSKHLLRRCLFGFTKDQIETVKNMGLSNAVDAMLSNHNSYAAPINDYNDNYSDPNINPGEEWVSQGYNPDPTLNNLRNRSFQNWWFGEMVEQPMSIQEKLTLFWHNHFATQISTVNFAHFSYGTNQLLRSNSLGNFKDLVKAITLDPGMLLYLNGYKNRKFKPDENYARELQELFTLGKGDASQYTEDDVKEAARILTGWTFDQNAEVVYFSNLHDTGDKQFSSFYNNQVIKGNVDANVELDQLIDMIFSQEECAKYIIRKLYRFFVYYVIDDEIESKVITPLSQTLVLNNFEIKPVLDQLFKSAHFFDPYTKGAIIKNPMDFLIGHFKAVNFDGRRSNLIERSQGFSVMNLLSEILLMTIGEPPNVAGWSAYHQSPQYHEHWINSVTLPKRNQIADVVMIRPNGLRIAGINTFIDVIALSETVPGVNDPNLLIDYWVDLLYTKGLTQDQKDTLKSILLYGQSEDYYWTVAWEDYQANKQDQQKLLTVYYILYGFYKQLFNYPEYQLS